MTHGGSTSKVADDSAKYPEKDLTQQIIGAAYEVHRELGAGFLEKYTRRH